MSAEVPVAIVGIGCKFPGGSDNKDLYYEFLRNKGDGMVEPPPDRWIHAEWNGGKDEPGKYHCAKAGFINGIDQFDHLEFGISSKEAAMFDPAIRLTLEASQAALQDSGIDYRGSNTGVFFGNLLTTADELDDDRYEVNNYNGVGRAVSIRANRISFNFDLRGPSLTVDTACSASATAMHLALSSIRAGECDQALVVGANTIINPEHTVSFSKLGVLSPTGSSKSFDASADGYARAEGIAAVLIKRLDKAVPDQDQIYSVITGSAINANGKGKSLTMPEGDMQAETVKSAYRIAKRNPAEAFYVELHATGTKVGDPIEANAAGKVFSKGRPDDKLLRVGSVKANIGHAEGCSFMASLVKVSMMMHHKEIIPNIRFKSANPKIDFANGKMKVQTELEKMTPEMAASDGKWVTSISSYGVGGSNAHVVLETIETADSLSKDEVMTSAPKNPLYLFSVGSLTESSLGRWHTALGKEYEGVSDDTTLRSLARSLGRQTRAYPARSFAIAPSLTPTTKFSKPVLTNSNASPKLCLVFSGQGPQHIFMGRQLAEAFPTFLEAVKEQDRILTQVYKQESMLERTGLFIPGVECKLAANGQWPVQEVVLGLVFVQMAMTDLVRSLGIKYDFVVGHSIGEIAMGYASGHYDREMAVGIAVARAAAMTRAEGNGAMVALGVGVQKAKTMIRKVFSQYKVTEGLWIAGINSPQAVTVAGTHELIDAMVELANDPNAKVFAAKLRVGCAFHTPLMEPQEELFKSKVLETPLAHGTNAPVARVMSTTDGKWLDRELDVNYCWDNIRRPVLFGTAINKLRNDAGPEGVLFMEIAPHPVLKAYIEQCGGEPISLVKRPNPKVPAQNTGEHYQFLEGIGNLLSLGFKNADFDKLCASPSGETGFTKPTLPEYPYNKSHTWSESESERSRRLRQPARPIAPHHFRISVDSHPDLTGHIVFDAPLFPASGYVETILQNGAMVVYDVSIHKPFVMNGAGSLPAHAGCVINGNKYEFRASTSEEFINGDIVLDTVYATGYFSKVNTAYDPETPRTLDWQNILAKSAGSVTGDEFYNIIPSAYRYQDHFRNYLKEVHEIPDAESWGGYAYLTRLEVPADTPDVYGKGYCIHPGILDSITQCGLGMFMNMDTKQFDFNGVFLPVNIRAIRRWDSADAPSLDEEFKKGNLWTYFIARTWAPQGPWISDYVIANNDGKVLFTIEGFEIAKAPGAESAVINDASLDERLTTIWQPKGFPSQGFKLTKPDVVSAFTELALASKAGGKRTIRVADLSTTGDLAKSLDATLNSLLLESELLVEYVNVAPVAADADAKTSVLEHKYTQSAVVESFVPAADGSAPELQSFDVVLRSVDLSAVPKDIAGLTNLLVPNGVAILVTGASEPAAEGAEVEQLSSEALAEKFRAIPGVDVQVAEGIIVARASEPTIAVPAPQFKSVIVSPFEHGREGELVEIASNISGEAEFWITGNDDAAGIGALGTAACVLAEFPEFGCYSLLFSDHTLDEEKREKVVEDLRKHSLLLEQHMKVSKNGDVYVRRLVPGFLALKETRAPAVRFTKTGANASGHFPRHVTSGDVEVAVEAIGSSTVAADDYITFVGTAAGSAVVGISAEDPANVIIAAKETVAPLPSNVKAVDAAAVVPAFLSSWIALMERAAISSTSVVCVHDALSTAGFSAVQLAQRFAGQVFCTVTKASEAKELSAALGVSLDTIALIDDFPATAQAYFRKNDIEAFDLIFNGSGKAAFASTAHLLSPAGWYIHNQITEEAVALPSNAPISHLLKTSKLLAASRENLVSIVGSILHAHSAQPFKLRTKVINVGSASEADASIDSVVVLSQNISPVRIDPTVMLFNPRKSYLLLGGCSELGVRIVEWMVVNGARHIIMTSRRGDKGLAKVDRMYNHWFRTVAGCTIDVIAADAMSKDDTARVIAEANKAPEGLGGIFVMTVVLRDAKFDRLTQESFDTVYNSKVLVLNTLLECVDMNKVDFMLLFSTIGSVFGNAGQAAYCAAQLYLDKIAEDVPNTISMSFPPITDSGIFKRLVQSTQGKATAGLNKFGMTTAQVCNFIGDSLTRRIPHYVPLLAHQDVAQGFPACEPRLYQHLTHKKFLVANAAGGSGDGAVDSPASLLAALLGMEADQITENALITSFGLDSLGATRYSNQLRSKLNIKVSQIELLGSMTIAILNEHMAKAGQSAGGEEGAGATDDGSARYGAPLVPILNDKLAYDEPYTTDASPHQYRIWLAQREYDNSRKRGVSNIDANMSRFGATQWDTHEGYFVKIHTETPLDTERMAEAFAEVVQRHGALRTAFAWNEAKGKLEQTIYPSVTFKSSIVDLSGEADPDTKAYEMSLAANKEPDWKLDQLPLLFATMFDLGGDNWAFNIVIHHIIIDEASLGTFFYELFSLYIKGAGTLPEVQYHYSDFCEWLGETAEKREELRDEHLQYWAEYLQETQPLHLTLATPSERELAPVTQIDAKISESALESFVKVIQGANATQFAGFFAAYNILLHKYSDQNSFVVGTAVTQRNVPALSNVIGFFANMLPVKTEINDQDSFEQYLGQFKDNVLACLQHDDVTYEDIVTQAKTSSHGRSFFKHLFAPGGVNMETISQLEAANLDTKAIITLPNGEEQYEFLMTVHYKSGHCLLRFDNHMFTEEAARQFLDAYIALIEKLGREPDRKIAEISAVSDAEHDRILKELSSNADFAVSETCLHHLFETQVKKTPRFTAVEFEDQSLTYLELNKRANQIAKSLIQQDIKQGDIIAVCFDRGVHQIAGILAVLKAGCTYVPLDPDDPTLRKELMVEECGAKVLISTTNHSRDFQKSLASKVLIAYIDDPSYLKRLSRFDAADFAVEGLTPSSLAYVMFTSGSTGKPKGVMIEHRAISNLIQNSQVYGYQQGARVLSSLAYTFDPFVADVFGTLTNGATLVTGRKELVLGDIPKALRSLRISVLHVTPSILAVVPPDDYPCLDTVVVAGEALGKKVIEDWAPRVNFRNMYGPTEASVDCISVHVTSAALTGVIGRPMANCRIYILDKQLRPTPIGVEGELHIGGIQLARGYLNQPELTEQAFIPNPFVPGERLYKTGDIALYRTDGNIEYCGRADRQIKLRGQRIELGEVEDVIAKYPAVQRAAAVIRTLQDALAIVAFVEYKNEVENIEDEKEGLKMFVSERLPRFMYPSLIAALPELPTSRSGKIDRNTLKSMDLAAFAPDLTNDMGQPSSDVEVELMSIFSKVLKVDPNSFGVSHDLFQVGMNSLMAVQAAGVVSKTFNVHIGLNNIYLRPTLRELGTLVIDSMGQDSRAIMEAEDTDADFLIEFLPIKKKGIQPRFFIVHDITGMATPFMRLGAYMPNEMYAIGDKHFGSSEGFGTVESMAEHYISLIKAVQPQGPYVIGGYSYGGSVALSMASKLMKGGDEVAHLILFDPIFIPTSERQSLKSTDWTQRSIDRISSNFPEIGEKWKSKLRTEIRKNLDSMFDYEPDHYDGPTTLVVPKDRSWYRSGNAADFDSGIDNRNGWDARIKNLDMKVAAGTHDTMFTPAHVKTLASVVKEIISSIPGVPSQEAPAKPTKPAKKA